MHYVAIVGGQERQVEITEIATDRYLLVIDDRHLEVDAREVSPSTLSLLLGEQAYNIELERTDAGGNVLVRGQVVPIEVFDLRRMRVRRAQEASAAPDGPAVVAAPMPGKVVAVLVKEGQEVTAGQGLVVVEAMKMENELRAPKAGTVRQIRAEVGAAVESGAPLCVVE